MRRLYTPAATLEIALAIAIGWTWTFEARGQTNITPAQLASMSPLDESAVPPAGNFWLLSDLTNAKPHLPPFPCPPTWLPGPPPIYAFGNGDFVVDDTQQQGSDASLAVMSDASSDGGGLETPMYASCSDFPAGSFFLQIMSLDTNVSLAVRGASAGTNVEILSATSLPTNSWHSEGFLLASNADWTPASISAWNHATNLFLWGRLCDGACTGVLPLSWQLDYFNQTGLNPSATDSSGNTLLYDYEHGFDPNPIKFSIVTTNRYVNSSLAHVQLPVSGGVPSGMAVLLDSTNLLNANWAAYGGASPTINLGGNEGWHDIRIGLRGRLETSHQTWHKTRIKLDRTPPSLTITNPVSLTVAQSLIQLQGFCPEVLASFSYDLSNAAGSLTGQPILVIGQSYATNTWEFTTNFFQAFDVRLTNGPNTMTLHATDLAGNTTVTNLTITVDYSSKTNPPSIRLGWPHDGSRISGGAFTWRGWVDDPSDHVTAHAVDASGATNVLTGRVGRNGDFWIENIPLSPGTNLLQLLVTDVAGNSGATNIAVVRSGLALTIASLSLAGEQASGAISDPGYTVWVNGVKGTNNGDGTWVATGLQLRLSDDSVQARAIPNTDNGGSGSGAANSAAGAAGNPGSSQATDAESEMDWTVAQTFVQEYHLTGDYVNIYDGSISRNRDDWQEGLGGAGHFLSYSTNDPCSPAVEAWTWLPCWWPNLLGGHFTSSWSCTNLDSWEDAYPPWDAVDDVPFHFEDDDYEDSAGWVGQYDERNRITLLTADKPGSTGTQLYAVTAFVPGLNPLTGLPNDMFILPEQISLGSLGCLNPNGYLEAKLPSRSLVDVTPTVSGTNADFWDLAIQASPVVLQSLTVASNATLVGGTNDCAAVKTGTDAWVYLQANLSTADTNAANFIQWSGGEAVPGNPSQRRVTKTNSVETTVTATLDSTTKSLNVWIIWCRITNQFSGTTPANAQALWTNIAPDGNALSDLMSYEPGYDLGVQYYTNMPGHTGIWAYAKECDVATITPPGAHAAVSNGWSLIQKYMVHEFKDASAYPTFYFDDWEDDGPRDWRNTHTLDNGDRIYAIDGPAISQNQWGSTSSYELHDNFMDYVTWNGTRCSETNTFWHFQAGWKAGQSPPISPVDLGSGLISPLPTNNVYFY